MTWTPVFCSFCTWSEWGLARNGDCKSENSISPPFPVTCALVQYTQFFVWERNFMWPAYKWIVYICVKCKKTSGYLFKTNMPVQMLPIRFLKLMLFCHKLSTCNPRTTRPFPTSAPYLGWGGELFGPPALQILITELCIWFVSIGRSILSANMYLKLISVLYCCHGNH